MDPGDIFKRFFGSSLDDFDNQRFGPGHKHPGGHHFEADMFGDWHQQMHQQMQEMERQMTDVFRIFRIPDMHSVQEFSALPEPKQQPTTPWKPRDHMLKDGQTETSVQEPTEHPAFSSPNNGGIFSNWFEVFPKVPRWDRVRPEDMRDSDLDSKNPSSAEIADLLSKKKEKLPTQDLQPRSIFPGFSFHGNSISVQTVIGKDGAIEERRTVRDSSGREETTVTRRIGDSSHTVTTVKDSKGQEETCETFSNIEKDQLLDFDGRWEGRGKSPSSAPRVEVWSDDTRGIFRKFFGL